MTTQTKCKLGGIGLELVAIASSVGAPVAAVLQKYPIFKEPVTTKELSAAGVMVLLIVLLGFRRQLWPIIRDKLHVNSAGALIFWGVSFLVLLWLENIAAMLPDLRTICIAGLAGTGVGQVSHTAARIVGKKKTEEVAENA